ncbi:MAG: hypothetical protein ACRERV_09270, partial [Methylococcales bacterium]
FELEREKDGLKISEVFSSDALVGRAAVKRLAGKMPARGLIYFLYSYVFRLGLLDGKPGFVFCMMKAWYQSQIAMKKYDSRMGGKKPDVS